MKIQRSNKVASLVLAASAVVVSVTGFASSAVAQPANQQIQKIQQVQQGTTQQGVRVAPAISPMPQTPRLGFMGEMIYGYGMRVLSTNYGSPASQAGLERGDIILSINGRRILCQWDYNNALRDAVMYRGGFVSMTVRNIRYDMGMSYQQYVSVSTQLAGYGPVYPYSSGPVAAAQGGVPQGGGAWAAQGGGVAMRSSSGNRSQRPSVKEIAADKVPALKSGQQGNSQ